MPIHEHYRPGTPCWVDYGALDPEGARAFYGELFGWTFRDAGGYSFIELGGRVVGGFGRVPAGLPASWNTYLATPDARAAAVQVKERGGSVLLGPVPAGHDGRLLFALDACGAPFGLWEGRRPAGIVLVDEPGTWCGHELWTHDAGFYPGLNGVEVMAPPEGMSPCWLTFFATVGRAATSARAVELGATIASGRDRATIVRDPWGALLALT
ncbi:VOC family protein [Nonomuraea maheshkhaliensis]|uniref:VOC family protein n=1 Tax=Nonomuraea maheshkhaliensis TaxID=419590 RepID=A0ABN2GPQ6_9ACTN